MALLLGVIFENWHTILSLDQATERPNINQIALDLIYLFPRIQLAIIHSNF